MLLILAIGFIFMSFSLWIFKGELKERNSDILLTCFFGLCIGIIISFSLPYERNLEIKTFDIRGIHDSVIVNKSTYKYSIDYNLNPIIYFYYKDNNAWKPKILHPNFDNLSIIQDSSLKNPVLIVEQNVEFDNFYNNYIVIGIPTPQRCTFILKGNIL